jgi:hypothetical protein
MTRMLPTPAHIHPAYASCGRSPYARTFHEAPTDLDRSHCSWEKKGSRHNPQHAGWPIRGSAPSFSPKPANEAGGVSQAPDNDQLLGLPGPYQRHVIGTFNTCSWGLTEQSLIDTGRGYNLGGAGLPHTHSPIFPTSCLSFPLVAPPDLHFNQAPLLKPQLNFGEPVAATWSFDHSAIYGSLHLRLAMANGLSLAMGSQG